MTKEAKVGLLLGLLLIVGIAIVLRGVHEDANRPRSDLREIAGDLRSGGGQDTTEGVRQLAPPRSPSAWRESNSPAPGSQVAATPAQPRPSGPVAMAEPPARSDESAARPLASATRQSFHAGGQGDSSANVGFEDTVRYVGPLPGAADAETGRGVVRPFPSTLEEAAVEAVATARAARSQDPSVFAGNDDAVTPEAPIARPSPTSIPQQLYVVREGDDLSKIALAVYGAEQGRRWVNVEKIYEANRDILSSIDRVRVGQTLRIPALAASASAAAETGRSVSVAAQSGPTSTTTTRTYVVREGDTLWKIAARELGDGAKWETLLAANRDQLRNANQLRPGMTLRLSGGSAASAPSSGGSDSSATYTVREGDNLWRIAARELGDGARWQEIVNLNRDRIRDENRLPAGLVLRLPR